MNKNQSISIEIKPKTIVYIVLILAFTWLIINLHALLFLIFIAFSISAMLSPVVDYLHTKKIPKSISIIVIYTLFLVILTLLILLSYKPIVTQLDVFIRSLPDIILNVIEKIIERVPILEERINWEEVSTNIQNSFWDNIELTNFSEYILSGLERAFGIVGSVFGFFFNVLSVLVLSIYFIQFKEGSKAKLVHFLPVKDKKALIGYFNAIEKQLGKWLRAQILLMVTIGFLGWLGLEAINVEFSIPVGILAGLLEAIPNIGPIITWVIACLVAIGSNLLPWQIIFIAVWFILIQQLENYVIVPKMMEKIVGTNPVLTIITVLAATQLFGFWAALLAVPIVAIIQISAAYIVKNREEKN